MVLHKMLFCVLGGATLLRHFICLDDMELGSLSKILGLVHKYQQVVRGSQSIFLGSIIIGVGLVLLVQQVSRVLQEI